MIELSCRLPRNYPLVPPSLCLRLPTLDNVRQRELSIGLQNFVAKRLLDDSSSGVLIEAIGWIQDNIAIASSENQHAVGECTTETHSLLKQQSLDFSRLWIYSHHIYNKAKRRTILDLAHDLRLTGFCAPGKPGVICVEGCQRDVDDFWQHVRNMQWQRITAVHRENFVATTQSDFDSMHRFESFQEKCFESQGSGGHGTHMDRGQLLQFLLEHNCGDVFQLYFGVGARDGTAPLNS
jgi:Protein of unknown function (DUF1115)